MTSSEREKMAAGEWYVCIDDELEALRALARDAVFEHNCLPPRQRGNLGPASARLARRRRRGRADRGAVPLRLWLQHHARAGRLPQRRLRHPRHRLVSIGAGTLLGPGVNIYCPEHHKGAAERSAGLEIARPVEIGANAWIGGGAIILGGIRIGDGAIVVRGRGRDPRRAGRRDELPAIRRRLSAADLSCRRHKATEEGTVHALLSPKGATAERTGADDKLRPRARLSATLAWTRPGKGA